MLDDVALAFVLVFGISSLIYIVGRRLSPKSDRNENAQSSYACGERPASSKARISVSLYKYLIYFVVVDSSVILIAFASLALRAANALVYVLYLGIVLVSGLLLVRGGD
jgi:NADH:ubiquinone oxidoreductase subunit 3 (subunit A)